MKKLKNILFTTMLTIGAYFGLQAQSTDKNFVHKGNIWAQHEINFKKVDPTVAFVNVFKDKRLKGFGLQTLVPLKPFHFGTPKPQIPVVGIGPHWGKEGGNINLLAIFNTTTGDFQDVQLITNKTLKNDWSLRGDWCCDA